MPYLGPSTRSYDELARILNIFDTAFPDAIPNDSDVFDERVHDYVALCRHTDERELPEAYQRMMRLVTEQAPDAILTLHCVAEQEARRISEQPTSAMRREMALTISVSSVTAVRLRRAGDPGPVRRHPAAAQPAGVHRSGGRGVDPRRTRRPLPVHLRLCRMGCPEPV